ncbi:PKD domain-containing protein [Taibaiella koreensis]|uniref:PKD domain-containing protein n=1 Tax=Taibaiella koreensis TaxID=1268548 RepID=UPI000E599DD0|nr:PKD domain-containing protein [Taibaiella koreensis]
MSKHLRRWYGAIIVFLAVCFPVITHASHMIGGDVTYRCLGGNNFEITITLFQDCLYGEPGALAQDNPAFYSIFSGSSLVRADSVSAISTEIVNPNFSNACINNYPNTCMRKQVFRFRVNLPATNVGYTIVYERCCRNASINNIVTPGNVGVTYYATIPPFTSGSCPNNSAVFKNFPPQIICANNPLVYDFSASDPDGDSLSYRLCSARPGGSTTDAKPYGAAMDPTPANNSVSYLPPYSAAMPMSGIPPLQVNPVTGLMTGTPNAMGRFVVTVCVDEWRNGSVINTVSRDVQFVVTNCSKAVVANIPELPDEPNTYTVECKGFTVHFVNLSTGGFSYLWEFGVPGATSTDFEPTFTYPDTGTYVVRLTVNAGSTCPDSISRLVKIYPEYHADFDWAGKLCPGEAIQFNDRSTATYPPVVKWDWSLGDGSTSTDQNPVHVYAKPGGPQQVTLSSKSRLGCRDVVTKTLPMPYFDPFAGNDTIIVLGYPYTLNGTGSQFYQWTPTDFLNNPNIANPSVTFPDTGHYTYVLHGTSEEGCRANDTITIWVVSYGQIFVPNAFSPNGDGINDVLMPRIVGFSRINFFRIFNRYGQQVYGTVNDNYPAWDGRQNGKVVDVGTYFWVLNATAADGTKVTKKGDITLIR